ncbi:MAG: type II toxin-antitoxin system VapC family toxin [Candidatus Margulisbacteria bacterium]|jgi:predicted nucleic acid-binding protein|nr:type II toxin-antitoxin system VapC family toxin [Candidatus Margulisiibacteriota bacterium]
MSRKTFLLDTNTVITLLNGDTKIKKDFPITEQTDLFVSVITRMELLAFSGLTAEAEKCIRDFLNYNTSVVSINSYIEEEAIKIRRTGGLKLPDSIIAATAIALGTVLLTNDRTLLQFNWPKLQTRSIF